MFSVIWTSVPLYVLFLPSISISITIHLSDSMKTHVFDTPMSMLYNWFSNVIESILKKNLEGSNLPKALVWAKIVIGICYPDYGKQISNIVPKTQSQTSMSLPLAEAFGQSLDNQCLNYIGSQTRRTLRIWKHVLFPDQKKIILYFFFSFLQFMAVFVLFYLI